MVLRSQSVGEQDVADQQGAFWRSHTMAPARLGRRFFHASSASPVPAWVDKFLFAPARTPIFLVRLHCAISVLPGESPFTPSVREAESHFVVCLSRGNHLTFQDSILRPLSVTYREVTNQCLIPSRGFEGIEGDDLRLVSPSAADVRYS